MNPSKKPGKKSIVKTAVKTMPVEWYNQYPLRKYFPVIIVMLCLLLYGNTFHNDYTEDDSVYTKENSLVRHGFSDVKYLFTKGSMYGFNQSNRSSYRPLMLLSFMTEASLFGMNPHVFQLFTVLYFTLTCLILYFFLQKILEDYNPAVPIAGTLLFIFHPIHTDAVANFKGRDEILTLMFGLLSFYLLLQYVEKKKIGSLIVSIIAFSCSLLCKETSTSYLVIIPLVLYFFTSSSLKETAKLTIPFAAIVLVYLFIRETNFGNVTTDIKITIINNSLMAAKNSMDRYASNFVMLGKYLYMLFIPYPLSWDYSYPQFPIVSWANPGALIALLLYIGMGVLIIRGFKKKSIYSFAMLFYLITLFLTSNLVLVIACSFGERFLFSPSVGFCLAIPVLLAKGVKLNPGEKAGKKIETYYGLIGAILVIYTFIVIPRNADWENNYTLFKSGVKTSPNSTRTHGALAEIYMDSAQKPHISEQAQKYYYGLATHEFKRVAELFNTDPNGYFNLGLCYANEGYPDSARLSYRKALELDPKFYSAANNLGVIYYNSGQYDTAIAYLNIVFKANPADINALMNLGVTYQAKKNYGLAIYYDSLILKNYPNNTVALVNLSGIHNEIGMQYVSNNELDQALAEFTVALRYDSTSTNAIGNIGVVYQKRGKDEKARYYYQWALSKNPNDPVFNRDLQILNARPKK